MNKFTKITISEGITSLCKHCSSLINIELSSMITNLGEFYLNDVIIPPFVLTTWPDELILHDNVYNRVYNNTHEPIGTIKANN